MYLNHLYGFSFHDNYGLGVLIIIHYKIVAIDCRYILF